MIRDKHFGFKVDGELHYKIHYIAEAEGRSGNGQILQFLREAVRAYEAKNGKIPYPPEGSET